MNTFTRGIKNAFRNSIRTFSIVVILGLSLGLALTMLIAHQAVGQKIKSVESSVGNTVTIDPAGARGFSGGGNPLTTAEIAKVAALPNVTSVDETLSDRLTSSDTNLQSAITAGSLGKRFANNSGESFTPPAGSSFGGSSFTTNFTPPVTVYGTNDPSLLTTAEGSGTFTLTSGKVFAGNSTADVAVVGSALATKNNLKVGSTFTAYSTTITVIGIFSGGNTFTNSQLLLPLATEQTISSQPGDITEAIANVNSLTNVASVTSAAEKVLGSAADVTNASAEAQTTVAPLKNIQTISLYSLVGAVIAGSVIILLTMVMIVRERRREIGVTKAIGATNIGIMLQFMVEAVTLTILGAVIGIIIGFIAGNPITKLLVNNSTSNSSSATTFARGGGAGRGFLGGFHSSFSSIHADIGLGIIGYGLIAAIIVAIVGSAIASIIISKIRPAEVMRVE
jgi:putative ABC transport system permease protein